MVTDRAVEDGDGPQVREAEETELGRLRRTMDAKRTLVPGPVGDFVDATLAFGIAQTRYEYRGFAQRNWRAIEKLGKRLLRLMVALIVVLLFLGWVNYNTTREIQNGRRDRITNSCERGNHFVARLKRDIAKQPPVERAKSRAAEKETIALVGTLVPIGDCSKAVGEAGL